MVLVGDVQGRNAILLDDMADTCGKLKNTHLLVHTCTYMYIVYTVYTLIIVRVIHFCASQVKAGVIFKI